MARAFLLDDAVPLLTLTGPGGVGKTRLALTIASDVSSGFTSGVDFVDLSSIADPELVAATVATTTGVMPTHKRSITEALVAHLRAKQLLLILDNCEHVLPAVADIVAALLAGCPALQVLATSRAPLHVRGEQILPVDPLPLPAIDASLETTAQSAAVRLFVARARAVRPTFEVEAGNAAAVALLCRRLDGLPLAIELAAAHSAVLSPAALLSQMSNRFRLLADGARDLPARQRTMREAIAWSYDHLTQEVQNAFRQLAVFAGGWTLDAASAVLAQDEGDTLALLEVLVAQSLVVRPRADDERPARFTMLETIRAFGIERLAESDDAAATRKRQAAWCVAAARASEPDLAAGRNQVWWLARLDAELPNMRAALAWFQETANTRGVAQLLIALDEFWTSRATHYPELRDWVEAVLSTVPEVSGQEMAVLLHLAVETTVAASDPGAALGFARQAVAVAQSLSDPFALGRAYHNLALAWNTGGDQLQAEAAHAAALPRFREAGRDIWVALTLSHLGAARLVAGDITTATLLLDEALSLERQIAYPWGIATVAEKRAQAALAQGDAALAAQLLSESIAAAQEIGNERIRRCAMAGLVGVALTRHQPERAARLLGALDAEQERTGWLAHPLNVARITEDVRAALGDGAFTAAFTAGQAIPFADALANAVTVDQMESPGTLEPSSHHHLLESQPHLTPREHEILVLLCQRQTNAEMAAALFLSPRTIETHVAHVIAKLGATNRREAAALAVRGGLGQPGPLPPAELPPWAAIT